MGTVRRVERFGVRELFYISGLFYLFEFLSHVLLIRYHFINIMTLLDLNLVVVIFKSRLNDTLLK